MRQLAIAFLLATSLFSTGCGRVTAWSITRAMVKRAVEEQSREKVREKVQRKQRTRQTRRIANSRIGQRLPTFRRNDARTKQSSGP